MRRARTLRGVTIGLIALASACSSDDPSVPGADSTTTEGVDLTDDLQAIVDRLVEGNETIPGAVLHVETADDTWTVAAGDASTDSSYRIASNTKTYVAAAVLRLVEDGELDLDAHLGQLVSPESSVALSADGYDIEAITVRHLLLHTSGLYDYVQDDAYDAAVLNDPAHRWTRLEQLEFAMSHGSPVAEPGAAHAYADTGYILLGEIIERTTGSGLAEALRTLLDYEALDLDATHLESLEPAPAGATTRAHTFVGTIDAYDLDASVDLYGGGGLVAPMDELARFYRALLAGDVFHEPSTLDVMLNVPPPNEGEGAAMGIFTNVLDGETCWSHTGFWGTVAVTCPDSDTTVALAVGQALDIDLYASVEAVLRRLD